MAGVLGCDPRTVRRGRAKLAELPAEESRRPGPKKGVDAEPLTRAAGAVTLGLARV